MNPSFPAAKTLCFCLLLEEKKGKAIEFAKTEKKLEASQKKQLIDAITDTFLTEKARKNYLISQSFIQSKRYTKAQKLLEEIIRDDPYQRPSLFALLQLYEKLALHKKILPYHQSINQINPYDENLHFLIAKAALKLDEIAIVSQMIEPFQGKEQGPGKEDYDFLHAEALFRNGQQKEAISYLANLEARSTRLNIQYARLMITMKTDLKLSIQILEKELEKKLEEEDQLLCEQLIKIAQKKL